MSVKRLWVIRIISVIVTLAVMLAIFMFSAQNREQSAELSQGVTQYIVNAVASIFGVAESNKIRLVKAIHKTVRKAAHFSIYGALGISSFVMFSSFFLKTKKKKILICSVIFCFLYATSDEFHQMFVSGRGAQVSDVMLDTFGAFCGGMVLCMLAKVKRRLSIKKLS